MSILEPWISLLKIRSPVPDDLGGKLVEGQPQSPLRNEYGGAATVKGEPETYDHGGSSVELSRLSTMTNSKEDGRPQSPLRNGYGGSATVEGKPETYDHGGTSVELSHLPTTINSKEYSRPQSPLRSDMEEVQR